MQLAQRQLVSLVLYKFVVSDRLESFSSEMNPNFFIKIIWINFNLVQNFRNILFIGRCRKNFLPKKEKVPVWFFWIELFMSYPA